MNAIGLFAVFLSVVSAASASPIAPNKFVIDTAKPYVYIKFDHTGKLKSETDGEDSPWLWLRLVNNCNLPITVLTNGLGIDVPGVSIPYSVMAVSGLRGPSEEQLKAMPQGYGADVGTSVKIPPGGNLLFSVPRDRVSPHWYIQLQFNFALPGPKEG